MTVISSLKSWARNLKREVVALWIAARNPHVPWYAKMVAGAVAAYALSPIDLIPDFIPILGYLDDILIVPAGILLAVKFIPKPLMDEFREQARRHESLPKSRWSMAAIIAVWLAVAVSSSFLLWHQVSK